eukprot:jgi/Hompol1/2008/HPOL_004985-RA
MFDLNVPEEVLSSDAGQVLAMLVRFGYRGIAVNVNLPSKAKLTACRINKEHYAKALRAASNQSKGMAQDSSLAVRTTPSVLSQLELPHSFALSTFDIFTRLSIVLDNPAQNYSFTSSSAISSYDIIAVTPTTEKLFQTACQTLEVDIISLDMSARLAFPIRTATLNAAVQRGVYFEICYSASIRNEAARRQLISNAALLVRNVKGKNIIISSQARAAFEFRAPFDVMNLNHGWHFAFSASLFGLNHSLAKAALSINARSVILHSGTSAAALETYRGVLTLESAHDSLTSSSPSKNNNKRNSTDEGTRAKASWKAAKITQDDFISFAELENEHDPYASELGAI